MSSDLEALAARKELLVARASLQRLQAANELAGLRERLQWSRSAGSLLSSPAVRSLLVAVALLAVRRSRFARFARWAGVALTVVRIVRSTMGRHSAPSATESRPGP
jgi:hypothetical protein